MKMDSNNLISVINKEVINIKQFTDAYGEDGSKYAQSFIKENYHILKNLQENEIMKYISDKFGGKIDFAKSVFNLYIESELKDVMIKNLQDDVCEKDEEIEIYKRHVKDEHQKISNSIKELYDKRIAIKSEIPRLRLTKK